MLLESLCQAFGPSGCEREIRDLIENTMRPLSDEIVTDTMGNLLCHKKGTGETVLLDAHMDQVGLMVTFIEETGFLRAAGIGGVSPVNLYGRAVRFENGEKGLTGNQAEPGDINSLFIDGVKNARIGDTCIFDEPPRTMGDLFSAPALDDRAGCYVLIETARRMKTKKDVWFSFCVQEEVGLRGARCLSDSVRPDVAVAVDTTRAADTPGAKSGVALGKGPAIKVMDSSLITDASVRRRLIDAADGAPYQLQVQGGGTDGAAIHTSGGGIRTGGIALPCRYTHSANEVVDLNDLEGAIHLLTRFLEKEDA